MKINLSPENKDTLTKLRANVAQELKIVTDASGNLEAMKTDEAKRNDEIDHIERGIAVEDVKTVQSLEVKRAQLSLLRRRIMRLEEDAPPVLAGLNNFLHVHEIIAPTLEPTLRENIVEAARSIHPLVGEWALSLRTVCALPAIQRFSNLLRRRYGLGGDPIGQAREVISFLDALLEGKEPAPLTIEPIPDPVPFLFPWEGH